MINSDWTNIFNKSFVFMAIGFFLSLIASLSLLFAGEFLGVFISVFFTIIIVFVISLGVGLVAESPPIIRLHNETILRKLLISGLLLGLGIFIGPIMVAPVIAMFLVLSNLFLVSTPLLPAFSFYTLLQLLIASVFISIMIGSTLGALIGVFWQWVKLY